MKPAERALVVLVALVAALGFMVGSVWVGRQLLTQGAVFLQRDGAVLSALWAVALLAAVIRLLQRRRARRLLREASEDDRWQIPGTAEGVKRTESSQSRADSS